MVVHFHHCVGERRAHDHSITARPVRDGNIPAMATLLGETVGVRAEALPQRRRRNSPLAAADESSASGPVGPRRPGNTEQSRHEHPPYNLAAVKVLVVDDDAASLDYFSFALETYGAVVTVATSAREALQIVTQVSPDVILTDIAMPGEDGYWLLSEIRHHADGGVSGLPVVAATAYGRDHSRARVLAAGFLDHLPKPVDPEALWRAIAAAVGR
jgi:CheY-like chemotaxis protein